MVEFYGAALLAEEMEQLVCPAKDRVSHRDEGLHLLLQALGQLPMYLDRVQGARRDLPLVVLPLINDCAVPVVKPVVGDQPVQPAVA
jgi:chemosensory pili system protein ChpA (sensor histidine kinase/response regulator)